MKKQGKKIRLMQYIPFLFFLVVGGICGGVIVRYIDPMVMYEDRKSLLIFFAVAIIELYAAIYLQIITHEGGHLLFGLLSGYKYSSFRIGSIMLVKTEGKLKLKKFSLAGTGGQCLMIPPEMQDGKIPYVLYNLGGSLLNIIVSGAFLALHFVCGTNYFSMFCIIFSLIGFAFALMNGIPMRLGTVDNDGYNAFSLGKNDAALRSFWVQMKANEQISRGVRLKDMPKEWFCLPEEAEMQNSMTATMGVFYCNRLMDEHNFEEAAEAMAKLVDMDTAIVGLHSGLLKCDMIYCELISTNDAEKLEKLMDKQQKKFMKTMKNFPSVLRTEYANALIAEKDGAKAEKILAAFEKCAKTYPYASDIESERELVEIAKSRG